MNRRIRRRVVRAATSEFVVGGESPEDLGSAVRGLRRWHVHRWTVHGGRHIQHTAWHRGHRLDRQKRRALHCGGTVEVASSHARYWGHTDQRSVIIVAQRVRLPLLAAAPSLGKRHPEGLGGGPPALDIVLDASQDYGTPRILRREDYTFGSGARQK